VSTRRRTQSANGRAGVRERLLTASVDGLSVRSWPRHVASTLMHSRSFRRDRTSSSRGMSRSVWKHLHATSSFVCSMLIRIERMTINSAFRTVAQQYLLDAGHAPALRNRARGSPRRKQSRDCLALDVKEHGTWRAALESQGFRWLGPSDRVHSTSKGLERKPTTVSMFLAFQRLWNRNHPDDAIARMAATTVRPRLI